MGNLGVSLKKFLSNKNTVTIVGVLIGVVILYIAYNWRVNQAVSMIEVPYAKVALSAREVIEAEKVGTMKIPKSMIISNPNIITSQSDVLNKYVSYASNIPENGLFYKEQVMTAKEMPDSAFADIPEGYTIFSLGVTLHTTYGNSIFPGNKIDLFVKAEEDDGRVIFGRLIKSIKVLAVKDSEGNHVFESTVEARTPSELLFAVPDEMYSLLMKAGYIGSGLEIIPVPRNAEYTSKESATEVSSEYIQEFIQNKSVYIGDDETLTDTNNTTITE